MPKRTTQADPDGPGGASPLVREYVYDDAGRQVGYRESTSVGSEPWTCTTFDDAGRVATVTYPAWGGQPARTVTSNYAVGGNPTVASVSDSAGTITSSSDWAGRGTAYTDSWGFTTTTGYDNLGRVTAKANPAGNLVYAYGADDEVTEVSFGGQPIALPVYDSLTRMTGVTYPAGSGKAGNGTSGLFGFDDLGRSKSVAWTGPAGVLTSDVVTARDFTNRITDQSTDGADPNAAGLNYIYDRAGRLIEAYGFAAPPAPGAATNRYQYNYTATTSGVAAQAVKNGNRASKTVNGGVPVTYAYDHADRLTATSDPAAGAVNTASGTLAYDNHGNTSVLAGETHGYDIANRHMSTSGTGLPTVTYLRDATDRITQRTATGESTLRYAHTGDTDSSQAVLNTSNTVISTSIGLPGGAVLHVAGANRSWSYPNMQGSVAVKTDNAGAKTSGTHVYTPDGTPAAGGLPDTRPGNFDDTFLGGHQRPLEHAPGLQPIIEMGARQYHPILARFLETDPIEGGCSNDYSYVTDPINSDDLTGAASISGEEIWRMVSRPSAIPRGFWDWAKETGRTFSYYYEAHGSGNCVTYGGGPVCGRPTELWLTRDNGDACSAGTAAFKRHYELQCRIHDAAYDIGRYYRSLGYEITGKYAIDSGFADLVHAQCQSAGRSNCWIQSVAARTTYAAPIK